MTLPAEEQFSVNQLLDEIAAARHWRKDGDTVDKAVKEFEIRVPRQRFREAFTDLAAGRYLERVRAHEQDIFLGRIRIADEEEEATTRPRDAEQTEDAVLWHRTETPEPAQPDPAAGDAEKTTGPVFGPPPATFRPATSGNGAHAPAAKVTPMPARPARPAETVTDTTAGAVPLPVTPVRSRSATINALNDVWPELLAFSPAVGGRSKLLGKCDRADLRWCEEFHRGRKEHHGRHHGIEAGAEQRYRDIGAAVDAARVRLVEDLPAEDKNRLFQRRAS